jgi:hypothetical protein
MSARPGSKKTSYRAGSSVKSSMLRASVADEGVDEDEPTAVGRGAPCVGASAKELCSWAGGSVGVVDADAVGVGCSTIAVFCPHPASIRTRAVSRIMRGSRVVIDDLRVQPEWGVQPREGLNKS